MDKETIKAVLMMLDQSKSFLDIYKNRQPENIGFNQDLYSCENWLDKAKDTLILLLK